MAQPNNEPESVSAGLVLPPAEVKNIVENLKEFNADFRRDLFKATKEYLESCEFTTATFSRHNVRTLMVYFHLSELQKTNLVELSEREKHLIKLFREFDTARLKKVEIGKEISNLSDQKDEAAKVEFQLKQAVMKLVAGDNL